VLSTKLGGVGSLGYIKSSSYSTADFFMSAFVVAIFSATIIEE
jgi:hypothetical protein